MSDEKPKAYEFKHIRCSPDDVQSVINQHQTFFWEVTGTNSVVSKESHLERGGIFDRDTIYQVRTEERFNTIDFKRDKSIGKLAEIKTIESDYFSIVARLEQLGCSATDNYSSPPYIQKDFSWLSFYILVCLWIFPGIIYWRKKNKDYEERKQRAQAEWTSLKTQFDSTIGRNRDLLNI